MNKWLHFDDGGLKLSHICLTTNSFDKPMKLKRDQRGHTKFNKFVIVPIYCNGYEFYLLTPFAVVAFLTGY